MCIKPTFPVLSQGLLKCTEASETFLQITSCLETYLESRLKWSHFSWSEDEGLQPYVVSTPSSSRRYFLLSSCPAPISSCSSCLSCMFGGLPICVETWERVPMSSWEAKDPYSSTPTSCFLAKPKACELGSGNPAFFPMSLNQEHVTVWGWLRSFSSRQQGHMHQPDSACSDTCGVVPAA